MPRGETELSKHTLNLFPGDYDKLREFYPDIGAATIIRRIVRAFIDQVEKAGGKAPNEIDISI